MYYTKPLLTLLLLLTIGEIWAQTSENDSISVYNLEEIQVEAPTVIRKADMDVYHPAESTVELSTNGLDLLNRLMIPSLTVDEVTGSVKTSGNNVQIRINGREASIEQVKSLTPESVKRVEWIDNPGLRYNNAYAVLNFIVSNPSTGGSLQLNAMPMVNTMFGNYYGDLKLNSGKSQWNMSLYYKPTVIKKVHRDYFESFTFPDGEKITRHETPTGGKVKNSIMSANLSYSYIKPDSTIFYVGINDFINLSDLMRFNGKLSVNNSADYLFLTTENGDQNNIPKLSLYLEQHLKKSQILVLDFSASFIKGHSYSSYFETDEDNFVINDIHNYIRDFNQVYSLEADYIKNWNKSKFTGGMSYIANRNRSKYLYLDNRVFHQSQDKLYFFGEYFQRLGKFTLSAGIGLQYTDFMLKETRQGSSSWNWRPQATATYSINTSHQFRINFTSWQTSPSLSETNVAPQQTDGFQWNVGNPDLKTYNTYKLSLRYGFNFWRISGNFNASASTSPKAIAAYNYWEDDKLITSYENGNDCSSLSFSIAPQIQVVPQWFLISGNVEYIAQRSRGTGYKLYNHDWNWDVNAMVTHWNFSLMVQYSKARRSLWGQEISWGEDMSAIALYYKWKDWNFGVLAFMPFGKYDQGSKLLSHWNYNENHMRLDYRLFGVNINYNLQWGRQKHGVYKLIDSEATVEKSSAKTR